LLADEDASQEDIDAGVEALEAAIAQLEEVEDGTEPEPEVNREALEAAIKAAEDKDEADFTEESWSVLASALEDAKGLLADKNASQEDIDAAVEALETAMEKLVKLDDVEEPEKENGGVNIESDDDEKDNQLPATATNIYNMLGLGAMLLVLGMLLVFIKRKTKNA